MAVVLSPSQWFGLLVTVLLLVSLGTLLGTAQDYPLSPKVSYVLSGTVTDAGTGWPLYAALQVGGYAGESLWSDPESGFYSVTLAAGQPYTVQVSAWAEGYRVAERDLGPLLADRTEDFGLDVDPVACTAPGYQHPGLYERFENDGSAPTGWEVVDNVGNGQVWRCDNPEDRDNYTGGSGEFCLVDSDFYGQAGQQDTELRTPITDSSKFEHLGAAEVGATRVVLKFDTDYWTLDGSAVDIADVDVSVNGGQSWENVWRRTVDSYRGPRHEEIDLSAMIAGEQHVMVRFHYYDASFSWWWQVDNVFLGDDQACLPKPGGLLVGNVYGAETGQPLIGAHVQADTGASVQAVGTQLDRSVDDAFYLIHSPPGSHVFTATMEGSFRADSRVVDVPDDGVVRQDFFVRASACEPIRAVDLDVLTPIPLFIHKPISVSVSVSPTSLTLPYSYSIDFGDGLAQGTSGEVPLLAEHVYTASGTYVVEAASWNCDLDEREAVTDSVAVEISEPYPSYLPLLMSEE